VRFLDEGSWTTLTPGNSGISGEEGFGAVFGVVVDKQDRVWIGSSQGVSIAQVEEIQPLSEREALAHQARVKVREVVQAVWWAVPGIFGFLWLGTVLSVLPGVALAAVLGGAVLLLVGVEPLWVIPGVMGLCLGMLCGLVFGLLDKQRKAAGTTRRGMAPAFAGWLIGSVAGLGLVYYLALSGVF
jgi:hypothetical protein